jgi:pimeloyl-ACP methyl ester carboxylesterase
MILHYTKFICNDMNANWLTFIHGAGGNSSIWFNQIRFFEKHFNLILIDLRGHGKSKKININKPYTFDGIANDIIEVLNFENIKKSHFVGISLGSILIRKIAENHSNRISKMVFGGAILNLNLQSKFLMLFGKITQSIIPFMWLYSFFAYIILPYKNHTKSRLIFIQEAKKLTQEEFKRWYNLTSDILPLLKVFRNVEVKIPTLYIMGSQDYMFLSFVKKIVLLHKSAKLLTLSKCGHVVNIEKPNQFNQGLFDFLKPKIN